MTHLKTHAGKRQFLVKFAVKHFRLPNIASHTGEQSYKYTLQ